MNVDSFALLSSSAFIVIFFLDANLSNWSGMFSQSSFNIYDDAILKPTTLYANLKINLKVKTFYSNLKNIDLQVWICLYIKMNFVRKHFSVFYV